MTGAPSLSDESLRQIMAGLRLALLTESKVTQRESSPRIGAPQGTQETGVFERALQALQQLAKAETSRIAPHLHLVLPPLGKRMFLKAYRDRVQDVLKELSTYG